MYLENDINDSLKNWYIKRLNITNVKLSKIKYASDYNINSSNINLIQQLKKLEFNSNNVIIAEKNRDELEIFYSKIENFKYTIQYDKNSMEGIDFIRFIDLFKNIDEFYTKFARFEEIKIIKYKNNINEIVKTKWEKQIKQVNLNIKEIYVKIKAIDEKKTSLNNLVSNNSDYNKVLKNIKEIIIKQNLQYCPVCKNDKFEKAVQDVEMLSSDNNTQILHIIDKTMSKGNITIYELQTSINKEEKVVQSEQIILLEIINEISGNIEDIKICINNDYNNLLKYYNEQIECIKQNISQYSKEVVKIRENISSYNLYIQDIKRECNIIDSSGELVLKKICDSYLELKEYYCRILKENYGLFDTLDEIIKLNVNTTENNGSILDLFKNIKICKSILASFTNLEQYRMDENEKIKLNIYIKLRNKSDDFDNLYMKLDRKIKNYDSIGNNIRNIEGLLINSIVKQNPLALWIYKQINPHPLYKQFKFKIDGADTNIVFENNDHIYLDHIFSSAQLNVLALCIFLGFSLMRGSSTLNQIFLDDPIQNMDDYNVLSVIDIFRALTDKKLNKKIIVSTHDENFMNLLAVKFRNRRCKIFNFVEYNEFGPIIKEII